jgi:hypothetical protein
MALALPPAIAAWLRRAGVAGMAGGIADVVGIAGGTRGAGDGIAGGAELAVRGSVVLAALSERARRPDDVDHLLLGDGATLADAEARLRAIAGAWPVAPVEVLWPDSPAPGIRAVVTVDGTPLQVDIAVGEPLEAPTVVHDVPGVGAVRCAALADLCAWKIHNLVELGRGQWRPKDVYDLDVIAALLAPGAPSAPGADVYPALLRAFASRADQLALLDDFLDRPGWGESTSGRKRWRAFARTWPAAGDFAPLRDRVRAFVAAILRTR